MHQSGLRVLFGLDSTRSETGLDDKKIFLPSWNEVAQTWSAYPMSSGEATCWIRELLFAAHVPDSEGFQATAASVLF